MSNGINRAIQGQHLRKLKKATVKCIRTNMLSKAMSIISGYAYLNTNVRKLERDQNWPEAHQLMMNY